MKKLPIGIQNFKEIRTDDYLYVDKTRQILNLIDYGKYFFLSRPRRFGKSLLCSTLHYLFSGEKELFKGLFAYEHWKWESYPVIRLDMSKVDGNEEIENVRGMLLSILDDSYGRHELERKINIPQSAFDQLIKALAKKYNKKVVIILDEYDKPILDVITNREKAEQVRELLANFYINIKNNDEYIRFAFITGITKFTKTSIFSKLNNLEDISLYGEFEDLVGITEEEIKQYLWNYVESFANENGKKAEEVLNDLRKWYNGYCWNPKHVKKRIYNPFSLLNALKHKMFQNYWIETGVPSFLIKSLIKKGEIGELGKVKTLSLTALAAYEIENAPLNSFLFQTGFLTIVGYDEEFGILFLDFPNKEVSKSFSDFVLEYCRLREDLQVFRNVKLDVLNHDWKRLEQDLNYLLSFFPYELLSKYKTESPWHGIFYLLFLNLFPSTRAEESTRYGKSDIVIDLGKEVVVIEVKMDKARDGIEQIKAKKYHEKYKDKKVYLLEIRVKGREVKIRKGCCF